MNPLGKSLFVGDISCSPGGEVVAGKVWLKIYSSYGWRRSVNAIRTFYRTADYPSLVSYCYVPEVLV